MKNEIIPLNHNMILKMEMPALSKKLITAKELSIKNHFVLEMLLFSQNAFVLYLDLEEIKDITTIIKNIIHLYHYCQKCHIPIGEAVEDQTLLAYINHFSSESSKETLKMLQDVFFVLSMNDIKAEYNYIYDKACDEMDKIFSERNLCDFKNDSCIRQRNVKGKYQTMGCCYAFDYGWGKIPIDTGLCKYLSPTGCTVKCLGCKLFTCRYLKKQKISFSCDDVFLLKVFLNKNQKKYTNIAFFKTKEEILKYWLENK